MPHIFGSFPRVQHFSQNMEKAVPRKILILEISFKDWGKKFTKKSHLFAASLEYANDPTRNLFLEEAPVFCQRIDGSLLMLQNRVTSFRSHSLCCVSQYIKNLVAEVFFWQNLILKTVDNFGDINNFLVCAFLIFQYIWNIRKIQNI